MKLYSLQSDARIGDSASRSLSINNYPSKSDLLGKIRLEDLHFCKDSSHLLEE